MKNLSPFTFGAKVVEAYFTENYGAAGPWPYGVTMLALSLANNNDDRMVNLATVALKSQNEVTRAAVLDEYAVPFAVRQLIEDEAFIPAEPRGVETFEGDLSLDAEVSREILKRKVDAERDRRIDGEFTFNGVIYQSRPEDRENLSGAATSALAAMVNGAQPGDLRWHGEDTDFEWIAADNSTIPMDAQTMFTLGQTALAHKSGHIFAARALKNADPIPEDYADDKHWPGYVAPATEGAA